MIAANIEKIRQQLPEHVKLIAVSKTKPIELLREAYDAGQRAFGENKVQEMVSKQPLMPPDTEWHLIGHLQSNKVKYIAPFVHLIHSVDSFKLLQVINKEAEKNNRIIDCLIQVCIADEETKTGIEDAQVETLLTQSLDAHHRHIRIRGLMGISTNTDDVVQVRSEFLQLKQCFDRIRKNRTLFPDHDSGHFDLLSMGMSNDYELAIDCGSNMIRVGSIIFGDRLYHT